ncbi:carboxypeptidase-like regulatory domain-containing protein [Acinetobacter bereziniae]|nr:carboxypeptidase-like regulatory domain-containing protein [Acinetobacter bereziniae]MBI0394590.1 carboxypeptidase regulatory-like domain-containing protein [Acinetobacter bereziniae]MBJ8452728.1 carboxypeptidase regulatory-like domain-containing protein [Acinetobacter bereziniae]MBJ8456918.1 carboxypeptidase regulatory-like domain-containing protein [Acinetobacter bereziniae]MBJ9903439.1 carboxypeptidase regulatory-like domain-containing protein [Acinetobacter bereziniae]MCU4319526.1 carbo
MRNNLIAVLVGSTMLLTACGNDSTDSKTDNGKPTNPALQQMNVNSIQILDSNNQPFANLAVKIASAKSLGINYSESNDIFASNEKLPDAQSFTTTVLTTDQQGFIKVNNLSPDQYFVLVNEAESPVMTSFVLKAKNTNENVVLKIPFACSKKEQAEIKCAKVDAVVGSLSGYVTYNGKPIKNAQVSLSGTSGTNGAFITDLTNDKGQFNLSFNVSKDFESTLKNASLQISADGYETLYKVISVNSSASFGNQLNLKPITTPLNDIVWKETFEQDSPTVNMWTKESSLQQPMWNLIKTGHSIQNKLVDISVLLAPNDSSQGTVPNPPQGIQAYWFGDIQQGNFIGKQKQTDKLLDGGTSVSQNDAQLTSPSIDLSKVSKPISLNFKTWWEIESVNPNNKGFDLMDIQVSTDGGKNYKTIARLNPLSDPVVDLETKIPRPFTNFGFNNAPAVSQQEPISLDEFAGQANVKLRFQFSTEDGLYNGFRGWMIDDIQIKKTQGTFPLFKGKDESDEGETSELPSPMMKKMKMSYQSPRWLDVPQR